MAAVSGRLQIRSWTDKEGGKRKAAEVVAERVYFADSKRDTEPASANAPADFSQIEDDGELPF